MNQQTAEAAVDAATGQRKPLHPGIQLALNWLLGQDPELRLEIVEKVCDTLGTYPRFWREEPPPTNTLCCVKVGVNPRLFELAIYDGSSWKDAKDHPISGTVSAWAVVPS